MNLSSTSFSALKFQRAKLCTSNKKKIKNLHVSLLNDLFINNWDNNNDDDDKKIVSINKIFF